MVPLDDWIGTYPIFLQVLLNIQDATPLKPGCNTTNNGRKELLMCFFWNCETHGGGRYVRKDHGSHNKCFKSPVRGSLWTTCKQMHPGVWDSHYIRFSSSILFPYNHWLYLHFPSLWWSHPHFSYSNPFFSSSYIIVLNPIVCIVKPPFVPSQIS